MLEAEIHLRTQIVDIPPVGQPFGGIGIFGFPRPGDVVGRADAENAVFLPMHNGIDLGHQRVHRRPPPIPQGLPAARLEAGLEALGLLVVDADFAVAVVGVKVIVEVDPVHVIAVHDFPHAVQNGFLRRGGGRYVIVTAPVVLAVGKLGKPHVLLGVVPHGVAFIGADAVGVEPGVQLQAPFVGGLHRVSQRIEAARYQRLHGFDRFENLRFIVSVAVGPHMEDHRIHPIRPAIVHQRIQRGPGPGRVLAPQQDLHLVMGHPNAPEFPLDLRGGRLGGRRARRRRGSGGGAG